MNGKWLITSTYSCFPEFLEQDVHSASPVMLTDTFEHKFFQKNSEKSNWLEQYNSWFKNRLLDNSLEQGGK